MLIQLLYPNIENQFFFIFSKVLALSKIDSH